MSETENLFISEFANLQLRRYCLGTKIFTYIVGGTSHLIISSTLLFFFYDLSQFHLEQSYISASYENDTV